MKKKPPRHTSPKKPTDPTTAKIHLCEEIPNPGRVGKKRRSNLIEFQSLETQQVTQDDIAGELALREALLKQRNYIREILEAGGKVEPGPHSAKLVNASWAVGGKTLEIR